MGKKLRQSSVSLQNNPKNNAKPPNKCSFNFNLCQICTDIGQSIQPSQKPPKRNKKTNFQRKVIQTPTIQEAQGHQIGTNLKSNQLAISTKNYSLLDIDLHKNDASAHQYRCKIQRELRLLGCMDTGNRNWEDSERTHILRERDKYIQKIQTENIYKNKNNYPSYNNSTKQRKQKKLKIQLCDTSNKSHHDLHQHPEQQLKDIINYQSDQQIDNMIQLDSFSSDSDIVINQQQQQEDSVVQINLEEFNYWNTNNVQNLMDLNKNGNIQEATRHFSQINISNKKDKPNDGLHLPIQSKNLLKLQKNLSKIVHRSNNSYLKLIKAKNCQICKQHKQPDRQKIETILCDICDDAYHSGCLENPIRIRQLRFIKKWICPLCKKQRQQISDQLYHQPLPQEIHSFIQGSEDARNYQLFYKDTILGIFKSNKYLKLQNLPQQQWTRRQGQCFKLKPFNPIQQRSKYWSSLISALSSSNHIYCPQQLYKDQQTLNLNRSKFHLPQKCQQLQIKDEYAFERYLQLIQNGQVPPLTVQSCPVKGFMIRTLDRIQTKTIICQYGGQVLTYRNSLKQKNNSTYSLLQTGSSLTTLNIVPKKFANISKYFLGINNSKLQAYAKINVQPLQFSYKGRNRIIFYTCKEVQKGEQLYIDYNGGISEGYVTDDFI